MKKRVLDLIDTIKTEVSYMKGAILALILLVGACFILLYAGGGTIDQSSENSYWNHSLTFGEYFSYEMIEYVLRY